jgi:hypothetical protein
MSNAPKIAILLIRLIAVVFSTVITASEVVYADKKDSKKNQKVDNKIECKIDIDHIKNSDVGPNNQQCDNESISLIDSTLIQSSPDNGDGDNLTSPRVLSVDPNDNENNVPVDTEIKVTFDRSMDQDTLDDGSLDILNNLVIAL